ncbi:hypothetical protein AYI68_g2606 [Smittium mucronatum]|uniref:Uncharacterized protein n=1 Tax=Smittium mucronatum TaxID=133383 RepID=A0A1R0H280_9FUNG|nr:hypothetical protein AYI68_g2606 [Smittium mucronatum]
MISLSRSAFKSVIFPNLKEAGTLYMDANDNLENVRCGVLRHLSSLLFMNNRKMFCDKVEIPNLDHPKGVYCNDTYKLVSLND